MSLFNTLFYNPILEVLIFIYRNLAFRDLGLAIIILTIFIRLILFPIFHKSAKHQAVMQRLQPHIKKIQHDHKDNKEKQAQALLELYKTHQINPMTGLLLFALQLPVLIAIYQVFLRGLSLPVFDHYEFLGLLDLKNRSILMVGLAAAAQLWQGKLSMKTVPADKMARYMLYLMPLVTVGIMYSLPAAVALYWLTSTLFSVGQQFYINHSLKDYGTNHGKNKNADSADGR